jgi:predicted transcriptional regulator
MQNHMPKINRIEEYLEKAGYEKGRWSAFSRYSGVPIWRLSKILRGEHPPSLSDMYRITDTLERKFNVKLDPRDIFLP